MIEKDTDESKAEEESDEMTEITTETSKNELMMYIQKGGSANLPRTTMKNPDLILQTIENSGETVETLALKLGISEREVMLAIIDSNDIQTRTKIADALNMTFFSVFGK